MSYYIFHIHIKMKGFSSEGKLKVRTKANFNFNSSNLLSSSLVHFILSPSVNFLYRNFTVCEYPSIHSLQYPNNPSSLLTSFFEEGGGRDRIPAIFSGFKFSATFTY